LFILLEKGLRRALAVGQRYRLQARLYEFHAYLLVIKVLTELRKYLESRWVVNVNAKVNRNITLSSCGDVDYFSTRCGATDVMCKCMCFL